MNLAPSPNQKVKTCHQSHTDVARVWLRIAFDRGSALDKSGCVGIDRIGLSHLESQWRLSDNTGLRHRGKTSD
jgi:hypothetical protein